MQADTWSPTHLIPPEGMRAWAEPNPKLPPAAALAGGTEVEVASRRGAWAEIRLATGWTAWVDDRLLVAKPPFVPTHEAPPEGLRAWLGPDPKAPVVASVLAGTPLEVVSKRRGWAKVRASNGFVGWVDRSQLVPVEVDDPDLAQIMSGTRRLQFRKERVWTAAGGVVVLISALLTWSRLSAPARGFDVPFSFLIDYTNRLDGGITVGLVLVAIGLAGVGLGFVKAPLWVGRLLGWMTVAVVVLFTAQFVRLLNASVIEEFFSTDVLTAVLDNTGIAPVIAAAGAAMLLSGR